MHAWWAIQESLDYIEEHLSEDIPIEDIAKAAGLSRYHFQRVFHRTVNRTVREYIKLRRLSESLRLLKSEDVRILDIAVKYGFSSHTNYSRAFKEVYGITPTQYRMSQMKLGDFPKSDLAYCMTNQPKRDSRCGEGI